jgi:hypothetical protein
MKPGETMEIGKHVENWKARRKLEKVKKGNEKHQRSFPQGTIRPRQSRIGYEGAGHGRAEYGRAGQDEKGQTGQVKAGQSWAGPARPGQAAEGPRRAEEASTPPDGAAREPEMAKRLLEGL